MVDKDLFGPLYDLSMLERCIELEDVCKRAIAAIDSKDAHSLEGILSLPKSTTLVKYLMKHLGLENSLIDALLNKALTEELQLPLPVLLDELEFIHLQLELGKKVDQREVYEVEFHISQDPVAAESLKHYVDVGKVMISSTEVQELKNVLCRPIALGQYGPFGFICESSGTGKTQVPFSLDVPYLYFLYSIESEQQIYDNFKSQSRKLKNILDKDRRKYFRKVKHHSDKISKATVSQVSESSTPFRVVGFIVSMIRKVVEGFNNFKGTKNSALIQTAIKSIMYRPMTVSEGRLAIQKLLKNGLFQISFPVFFDECGFQRSDLAPKIAEQEEELGFMLLRGLMRSLLCHPIFMGTNAEAANFLGVSKGIGSGNTKIGSAKEPWCIIIHKLPGFEEGIYKQKFDRMRTKLKMWRDLKIPRPQFPNDELISFLEEYLKRERPIFTYYTESFLDEFISSNEVVSNNSEFFGLLIESICVQFRDRKDNIEWMNLGQMAYMCARSWGIVDPSEIDTSRPAQEGLTSSGRILQSDLYIHRHLGMLDAIPDDPDHPFYTTISSKVRDDVYTRQYYLHNMDFKIASTFPIFTQSPILGFVCTGLDANNQSILVEEAIMKFSKKNRKRTLVTASFNGVKRTSVCRAIWAAIKPLGTNIARKASATSGFVLELALYCAALTASRANGLLGCDLLTFLRHLVRELNFTPSYNSEEDLPEILLHADFLESFVDFKVPFISPMATDSWDIEFVNGLKRTLLLEDVFLGVGIPSINQSPADFILNSWPNYEMLMCGECKLYTDNIDASTLRERVINKFKKYPECNLFLAVAPFLAEIEKFYDSDYCVWYFFRRDGKLVQHPINTKEPQPTKAKKHVVFLELKTIFTGEDFSPFINHFFNA